MFQPVATYHPLASAISRYQLIVRVVVLLAVIMLSHEVRSQQQQLVVPLSGNEGENTAVALDSLLFTSNATQLNLSMNYCLIGSLTRQQHLTVVPRLTKDSLEATYPAIHIYGQWAYYHIARTGNEGFPEADSVQVRDKAARTYATYRQYIDKEPWMDDAKLTLLMILSDGCGNELNRTEYTLAQPTTTYNYWQEENNREERVKQLTGRAYVGFPVNQTVLLTDFRNNRNELRQLKQTIDSVSNDSTIQILRIEIKGYASPEGSYENNDRLARGRTSSLTRYIIENTSVSPVLFHTAYEAEDWAGLRTFVDTTATLGHREELLQLIDTEMHPDAKLARIKSLYPAEYKVLNDRAFPILRHTDYLIDYELKNVTEHEGEMHIDTIYHTAFDTLSATLTPTGSRFTAIRPWVAIKTNLLYDLALAPNIEVELPLGRRQRWSVMAEFTTPWYRWHKLDYSYEIQLGGLELRRWFAPRCDGGRPMLCGHFLGLYAATAKYDLEYDEVGDQGEITSFGLTYGHSWPLCERWNLEASFSAGILFGERRHYNAMFESTHLIYQYTKNMFYAGPTKIKLSLVYLFDKKLKLKLKKGGKK